MVKPIRKMPMREPDELDQAILRLIDATPGINMAETAKQFLRVRSEPDLRYRIKTLVNYGYIKMSRCGRDNLLFRIHKPREVQ